MWNSFWFWIFLLFDLFLLIAIWRFSRKQKMLEVLLTTVVRCLEGTPDLIKEIQKGTLDEELKKGNGRKQVQTALISLLTMTMDSYLDFGFSKELSFSKKAIKVFRNNPVIRGIFEGSYKELKQILLDRK